MLNKLFSLFQRKDKQAEKSSNKFTGELSYLNDIPQLNIIGSVDLFEIMGKTIVDLRHEFYCNKIDGWMDYSQTFITLHDGFIIVFPVTGSEQISVVKQSGKAKKIDDGFAIKIIGQKIVDVFYEFYENEPDGMQPSYLLLSNGCALSEQTIGIHGTGSANLFFYSKEEFQQIINDPEANRRSVYTVFNKENLRPA